MKWKYYIPHVWDSPEDRTIWEDVYLMPEDGSSIGKSYWFTLNAIGSPPAGLPDGDEWFEPLDKTRERNLRHLGDREYLITDVFDMLIRAEDFDQHELLEWARVFIRDQFGDTEPEFVLARFEDFGGTNNHASEIGRIAEAIESGVTEEEVVRYRQRTCESAEGYEREQ
jgi:hypothetical protein